MCIVAAKNKLKNYKMREYLVNQELVLVMLLTLA